MKNYAVQVVIGLLLAVSGYSLAQATQTLDRIEKRVDRLEVRAALHYEDFELHHHN